MNDDRHAPCLAPVRRLKIGAPPCLSLCPSVCDTFVTFQKRGFEISNINLSNTTKLILLDSIL